MRFTMLYEIVDYITMSAMYRLSEGFKNYLFSVHKKSFLIVLI